MDATPACVNPGSESGWMDPGGSRRSVEYGAGGRLERAILNHRRRRPVGKRSTRCRSRECPPPSSASPVGIAPWPRSRFYTGWHAVNPRRGTARAQRLAPSQCALAATADRCMLYREFLFSLRGRIRVLPARGMFFSFSLDGRLGARCASAAVLSLPADSTLYQMHLSRPGSVQMTAL